MQKHRINFGMLLKATKKDGIIQGYLRIAVYYLFVILKHDFIIAKTHDKNGQNIVLL